MSTVEQLKERIVKHDWWYKMSDYHPVWRAGLKNWDDIVEMAEDLGRLDIVKEAVKAFNNGEDIQKAIKEM